MHVCIFLLYYGDQAGVRSKETHIGNYVALCITSTDGAHARRRDGSKVGWHLRFSVGQMKINTPHMPMTVA